MPTDESDLWPSDLTVDVVPPLTILKEQAEALSKRTGGIVKAEIVPSGVPTTLLAQYSLDLLAPAIGYRHRILLARYDQLMPYPVVLIAEPLLYLSLDDPDTPDPETWKLSEHEAKQAGIAYSSTKVRDLLKRIFNSHSIRAALFSMVTRSNEIKPPIQNESKQSVEPTSGSGSETEKGKGNGTQNH